MSIPIDVRARVKAALWAHADRLEWDALSSAEKSKCYTQWSESDTIGRILSNYMDPRAVRVYIKDTLLKSYSREKLSEHHALVLRLAGKNSLDVLKTFVKPHGLLFSDGVNVAWGRADDWKVLLGSLFERTFSSREDQSRIAVFFRAAPRFMSASSRKLVEAAAQRLGVQKCVWFD